MTPTEHVDLTNEQLLLACRLKTWYNHGTNQCYSYTGAAGTGKTTVIKYFIEDLGIERYMACAYVGKAVTVLSRHGLPASTIHSMIYNVQWVPVFDPVTDEPVLLKNGKQKTTMQLSLKTEIAGDPQLLIVDEATMVNDKLCADILSFGIKTVFIGDNNQLPPVFGVSSVMLQPNFVLTKIMRQAENDPIVYLSQRVLHRERVEYGTYGLCTVNRSMKLTKDLYDKHDIIVTGRNRTREAINQHVRHNILGIDTNLPVIGDKLMCKQNDWTRSIEGNIYLTTGMSGVITDINRGRAGSKFMSINFLPDISKEEFINVKLDVNYILTDFSEKNEYGMSRYEKFDFGYCSTVYGVQGSEYPNVLFVDQWFYDAELTKKTRYTAITRASHLIDITSEIILA